MHRIKALTGVFVFVLYALFTEFAAGQTNKNNAKYISKPLTENRLGLFERNDLLKLSLRYDLNYFIKEKPDSLYIDALLTIHFTKLDSINNNIRIRARGSYRYRTCLFPPIRLNFKKSNTEYEDLENEGNIKIVTHCDTSEVFEKYMLREFLVYKLYNVISDYSFKVRLLEIEYIDISEEVSGFTKYAFAIEPMKQLSDRSKGVEIENEKIGFNYLLNGQAEKIALFQYMIGNSDWFLPLSHNIKFIDLVGSEEGGIAAIPYDFDYCGFVNADYAIPRSDLGLESITDRVYLGPCLDEKRLSTALDSFLQYKEQFIDTIRNFRYLDRSERKVLEKYIESFYKDYRKNLNIEYINRTCIKNK